MEESLKAKIQSFTSIKMAKNHLAEIRKLYDVQLTRKQLLGGKIDKYIDEIDKLDGPSILAIHKKIQQTREHKLELYKQHYLNLVLEYNELNESLKILDYEIKVLTEKVAKHDAALEDLNAALKKARPESLSRKYKQYRKVIKDLDSKIILAREIEETLEAGRALNLKLNKALNYIVKVGETIIREKNNVEGMLGFNVQKMSTYQKHMVRIHEAILKFTNEMNDVYSHINEDDTMSVSIKDQFLDQYRNLLIIDINGNNNLANSYAFLKSNKNFILSMLKHMRADIKQLNKEILTLEAQEEKMIAEL